MMRKYLLGFAVFVLSFGVFLVSALHSSPSKAFTLKPSTPQPIPSQTPQVNYAMSFPGGILPDNPLWNLKAARDWTWYYITVDPLKKAELALLFSDKRLAASKTLFKNKKADIAVTTFTKGEKYLEVAFSEEEIARKDGKDTSDFLIKLATASLKHRQMTENDLLPLAPEDAKPEIIKEEVYAKTTYKSCLYILNSKGITAPKDPFNGQ